MRPWRGVDAGTTDDPRVREALSTISEFLFDVSAAVKSIGDGLEPIASGGGSIGTTDHGALSGLADDDHSQYLLLAGRSGGQTIHSLASGDTPLIVRGTTGQTADFARIEDVSGNDIFSFRAQVDMYLSSSTGGSTAAYGLLGITQTRSLDTTALSIVPQTGIILGRVSAGPKVYIDPALSAPNTSPQTWDILLRASHASASRAAVLVTNQGAGAGPLMVWQYPEGTNVAQVTSDGYFDTPGLRLMDATGDLLTIVPAAATTAHTLTMPAAQGSADTYLKNDGSGGLSWAAVSGGSTHNLLDGGTVHTDTAADTVSRGSLIIGNSTPAWDELVIGSANTVLRSDGTDPSWGAIDKGYISNRQRRLWYPAAMFETTAKSLTGSNPYSMPRISMGGTVDSYHHLAIVVPDDYVSTVNFKIWWSSAAAHATQVWRAKLVIQDVTSADTAVFSGTETTISVSVNGISANYAYATTGFTNPDAAGLTPGNLYRVNFTREASTDATDNFTNNVYFHGLELIYTADM